MKLTIIVGIIIVGIALAIRVGWKPSISRVNWKWIVGGLALILLLGWGITSCNNGEKRSGGSGTGQTNPPPPPVQTATEEVLRERFKGRTPCSTTIAWPFRIERYGQPLTVTYPGGYKVTYTGEEDTHAPTNIDAGEFFFTSPDTNHPNVRVRVYEKIQVTIGQRK